MKLFNRETPRQGIAAPALSMMILCAMGAVLLFSGCALDRRTRPDEAASARQTETAPQAPTPGKPAAESPEPDVGDVLPGELLDDRALLSNIRISTDRHTGPPNQFFYYLESQLRLRRGDMDGAILYLKKALEIDPEDPFLKRELTDLYLRNKENDKALSVMASLVGHNPEDVELLTLYGKLKQGTGDLAGARDAYEKVLELAPEEEEIYILLGNLYLEEEHYGKAAQVFKKMVDRFPESYAGHYLMGRTAQKQGRYRSAAASFERSLALEPELNEARFSLIDIAGAQGLHQRSETLYREILADDPDNVRALFGLALLYHKTGRKARARNILEPLGERAASEPDILRKIVQIYINEKEYADAAVLLEKMLETAPENEDAHYVLGVALSEMDRGPEAIGHLLKVGPDSMFYGNASVHIAFLYQEAGELKKAVDFMEKTIARRPENLDFRLYLASFHEELEAYDAALETLQNALGIAPDSPQVHFRMGVIHDNMGNKDASIAAMRKVIELEPDNANALNYLGYTLAEMGRDLEEAESLIQRALKEKPEDGYITDSLGWVYYQQGQYEKAAQLLERAVRLAPDDPIILEHMGDAYRKLGRDKEALEFYRRSLEKKAAADDKGPIRNKIRDLADAIDPKGI